MNDLALKLKDIQEQLEKLTKDAKHVKDDLKEAIACIQQARLELTVKRANKFYADRDDG